MILCEAFLNMHGVHYGEVAWWPDTHETWRLVGSGLLRYLDEDPGPVRDVLDAIGDAAPVETAVDTEPPVPDGWDHGQPSLPFDTSGAT